MKVLSLFFKGLPYFISPPGVRKLTQQLASMSDGVLRLAGLSMMAAGLLVTWLATR